MKRNTNLKRITHKNQQIDPEWKPKYLDAFPRGFHNRHMRRVTASSKDEGIAGGRKRDKKKCRIAKLSRRRNRQ